MVANVYELRWKCSELAYPWSEPIIRADSPQRPLNSEYYPRYQVLPFAQHVRSPHFNQIRLIYTE